MVKRQIKRQIHGQAHTVRVDSGPGWRAVLEDELREVLGSPLQDYKFVPEIKSDDDGIEIFNLDFRQLLELPLRILTASEILWRIDTRHVGSFGEYEDFIRSLPWEHFLPPGAPVRVRCDSFRSGLYHEGKLEKIARGILSEHGHGALNPKTVIRIEQKENRCTAYLALTHEPLFRRAYKIDYSHPAPLQEHLAAAAIRWTLGSERPDLLYVPFAGSGTMIMESWLHLHRPALDTWRSFTQLETLPDFPETTWGFLKKKLFHPEDAAVPARAVEVDVKGAEVLQKNLFHAQNRWPSLSEACTVVTGTFQGDSCPAEFKNVYLPMNPPYGLRLDEETGALYLELGRWLHTAFAPDQRRFGFVLLADSKAFHAFERGVGAQLMNGIQSFTQGGQHIRCVMFDIPARS